MTEIDKQTSDSRNELKKMYLHTHLQSYPCTKAVGRVSILQLQSKLQSVYISTD